MDQQARDDFDRMNPIEKPARPTYRRFEWVIDPIGKVRMTQSDKWKKRLVVQRYRAYHDQLREMGVTLEPGDAVTFWLSMPKSWSEKKRAEMAGAPHQQKPDLDNLLGGLLDGVLEEDKTFWMFGETKKLWTAKESRIIIIREQT